VQPTRRAVTMKTLLILRHAKSSWKQPELADHDRPLAKRGRRDGPRMGRLLLREHLAPDAILTSTARRAQDTAALVAEHCGHDEPLQIHSALYEADPSTIIDLLRELDDQVDRVMVVGHNPELERLLEQLTGRCERLPTAALVHLQLNISGWRDLDFGVEAALMQLWRPRQLAD